VISSRSDYVELRQKIKEKGLLNKQPWYYTHKIAVTLTLYAGSIAFLFLVDNIWWQLLNAVFAGFLFTQIGFLGHDAGHKQILASRYDVILLPFTFLIGIDRSWWLNKHDRHHANPNDPELDLDINQTLLAFSEEQAFSKKKGVRFVVKYQAFFLFPMMLLEALSLRIDGLRYVFRGENVGYLKTERALVLAHIPVYCIGLFFLLGFWQALAFIVIHQMVTGLYMSAVFAPNHKGMPLVNSATDSDFLRRQVLTARNVVEKWSVCNWLVTFFYGGLNYQIEHHLFTIMPRNNLGKARKIVMEFCKDRGVYYHETGLIRSYREILGSLHEVGASLREQPHAA
jgi:fatty acid desaturase